MQRENPIDGLQVALEMERRGAGLYQRAQRLTKDPELKAILQQLEEDEKSHYTLFKRMVEQYGGHPGVEESQLSAAKAGDVFYPGGLMQAAQAGALASGEAMLQEAVHAEQDSIAFYRKLLVHVKDPQRQAVISRIIQEEQKHLRILQQRHIVFTEEGETE